MLSDILRQAAQNCTKHAGKAGRPLRLYIASSFRNIHAVQLLASALNSEEVELLDWTSKAKPPEGLTPAERRVWMDTDHGGEVFAFCEAACRNADLVVYLGASGQDAGVEVGLARASGVPVLGIRGPLEAPGLMLYGAGTLWVEHIDEALRLLRCAAREKDGSLCGEADSLLTLYRKRICDQQ